VPADRDAALADIARLAAMMASGAEVTAAEQPILASIQETEARTVPLVDEVVSAQQAGQMAHALLMEQARPAFVEWLARIEHPSICRRRRAG
jgi:methyl-accepting chemotaxis protein